MVGYYLGYKKLLLSNNSTYTVVHWRRGDQLATRCAQGKDNSVNCLSSLDLVAEIRKYSNDKIVYIATNAHNMTPSDVYLFKKAGFQLFNAQSVSYIAHSVEALAVDVQLMIDATTFLGWGVSLINDLVEHARMLHRKSWCTTEERNITYPTWCWLQEQRLRREHPRDLLLLSRSERRDLLLKEDKYMKSNPLVLSEYNISNMPAYQAEIVDAARRMANLFN